MLTSVSLFFYFGELHETLENSFLNFYLSIIQVIINYGYRIFMIFPDFYLLRLRQCSYTLV